MMIMMAIILTDNVFYLSLKRDKFYKDRYRHTCVWREDSLGFLTVLNTFLYACQKRRFRNKEKCFLKCLAPHHKRNIHCDTGYLETN